MKTGIIGISGKCAKAKFSHNAGWSYVIKDISGGEFVDNPADIHNYDIIVINEGLNYKENKWNFVGGVSDYTHKILQELVGYQGKLVSYNEKIDLNFLVNKRKDFFYFQKDVPEDNKQYFNEVELLRTDENDKLIYGDSHSVSIYSPGYGISRNDGQTLNGFINRYSDGTIDLNFVTDLTLYLGNIDVRFHVHRFGGIEALNKLILRYTNLIALLVEHDVNVTVQELLPIEDENRKLPGTGLYRGEPFYGSREERQSYVDHFNAEIRRLAPLFGYRVSGWDLPVDGFEASTKYKCMESRQSVHIRPDYYLNKEKFITNE